MPPDRPTAEDPHDRIADAVPGLMAYACALVRSRDEAEDLVQETCLAALAGWDSFDESRDLGVWLRGILRNKHIDALRRRRSVTMDPDLLDSIDAWHDRAAPDILDALDHCLGRLPDALRTVLLRHHQDGVGIAALATAASAGIDVIKKRLQRGRALLLACMAGRGFSGTADPSAAYLPNKVDP
jgi:RNA polymerase sigma-70 factor (ECF subfamily)